MDYDIIKKTDEYVFFLHGFGGDKNSFKLAESALNKSLVFISFSGFGNSPPPSRAYFVKDYGNEVIELILQIAKGNSVYIVCHSFGARIASYIASVRPELVKKLVICDGAGVLPRRGIKYYIKVHKYKRLKKLVKRGKRPESELEKYGSSDYKTLSKIMKETFVKIVNEDLKKYFKTIKCPTLLFWGEEDKDTPLYMAKKMHRWIKGSKLIIENGAGHFAYLERASTFLGVLQSFI